VYKEWIDDLKKSTRDFLKVVYPQLKNWLGPHELIPVELLNERGIKSLDTYSGIDYLINNNNLGIRGLGSRVQWGKCWSTFTIRYERDSGTRTEYDKLCNAIDNDFIYPYWFCHAYIKNDQLQGVALAKTKDLINYIRKAEGKEYTDYGKRYVDKNGAAEFWWVNWESLAEKHDVKIYVGG